MKKSIIIIISCLLLSSDVIAQINYSDEIDENRLTYWFQIRVREVEDDSTGYVSYILTEVKSKLMHGTENEYRKNMYKSMKNDILNIGPFDDFDQAWKSKNIYEHLVFNSNWDYHDYSFLQKDSTYDKNQTIFWFAQHLVSDKKNRIELIRRPGAIASGTYLDFYAFAREDFCMRILTIGSFLYMPEAEKSKNIYRIKKGQYNRKRFFRALNIFKK